MGRHEDVVAVVEALAGPLTWHDDDHATGTVDGRPIGIEKKYYSTGGNGGRRLTSVTFAGDLGGRPIGLTVMKSDMQSIGRRPHALTTGDQTFDAEMRVDGFPEVACLAALDADTRRLLVDTFDGKYPLVDVEDGAIRLARRVLFDRPSRVATPDELVPFARCVQGMAARAVAAYDATYDEIRDAHGESAAQSWHSEQGDVHAAHGRRSCRRRAVPFVVFAAAMAGSLLWVASQAGLL